MTVITLPVRFSRNENIVRSGESATVVVFPEIRLLEGRRARALCSLRLVTQRAALRHTAQRANAAIERDMIDDDVFHNGEPVPR